MRLLFCWGVYKFRLCRKDVFDAFEKGLAIDDMPEMQD